MKYPELGYPPVDLETDEYGMTKWYWLVRHKYNFKLGKNTEIGNFTVIGCEYGVEIEDDVKIGYNCVIASDSAIDGKHGKIVLKRGCKIGTSSIIMPNVVIGENATIGANSFVNESIPDNEVWAGNPARRLH